MPSEYPDVITPTPERFGKRDVAAVRDPIVVEDENGQAIERTLPFRSVDIVGAMLRRGAITTEMAHAAERFRGEFVTAQLDPLKCSDPSRPMVSGRKHSVEFPAKIEDARESVWRAIIHVGGMGSAGGSCLWHVIGWESSLKEWATEQALRGHRVSQEAASGILICALGALESYYDALGALERLLR